MITTITVLPQAKAERLAPCRDEAIISITNPDAPLAVLRSGWTHLLRLQFTDYVHDNPLRGDWGDRKGNRHGAFQESHAHSIRRFVEEMENNRDITRLVIHCLGATRGRQYFFNLGARKSNHFR